MARNQLLSLFLFLSHSLATATNAPAAENSRYMPVAYALEDKNNDFIPDRLGEKVTVRGIVTIGTGMLSRHNLVINIQDSSGGIRVYKENSKLELRPGDFVEVTGKIAQYNGLEELIEPKIKVLGRGDEVSPKEIALAELNSEKFSGQLVTVKGKLIETRATSAGTEILIYWDGATARVWYSIVRVPKLYPSHLKPGSVIRATGIASQYDREEPYNSFYQLVPRSPEDIKVIEEPPLISLKLAIYFALMLLASAGLFYLWMHILRRRVAERTRELSEHKQRYQNLVDSIDGIVWECDAENFRFSFVSQQAERILGYPVEHWLREATFWRDHIHPDDRKWVLEFCLGATREKKFYEFEYWMIAVDGRIVCLKAFVSVVENDRPVKLRGVMLDITERKRAEEALWESEERFRLAFENAPIGMAIVGRDYRFLKVNKTLSEMLQYPGEELSKLTFLDITCPEYVEKNTYMVERLFKGETSSYCLEESYIKKNGEILWGRTTVAAIRDQNGKTMYALGMLEDITERKRAEEARARLAAIIEATPDLVAIANLEGQRLYLNRAGRKILGIGEEEDVSNMGIIDQRPEWARAFILNQAIPAAIRDGVWSGESAFMSRDGREIPVSQVIIAHRGLDGTVEFLSTIARDITERRKAEEEIRRMNEELERRVIERTAELEASNRKLENEIVERKRTEQTLEQLRRQTELILNSAGEGICSLDLGGRATFVNLAAAQILGYEAGELIGQPVHHILRHSKAEAASHSLEEHPIYAVLNNGSIRRGTDEVFRRKDGTDFPVEYVGTPIREDGELVGAVVVFKDITERKRAEEEIRQLNESLQNTVKELEAFSYSVSHDLRAPLRHIVGFAELLRKNAPTTFDEKSRHYLAVISDSAKQMGEMIDRLLAFSRMERAQLRKTHVNIEQLLKEVLHGLQEEIEGRKIIWKIGGLPEVYGDPSLLRLVLVNLLSNSLKFTRTRAEAQIEIGCNHGKNEFIFFVRDNGVGFDMKYADKLFGVFQRLHRAEEFEGNGIGLANVRRIVHRHGGRTWAEGSVGIGATFYFSLPKLQKG